MNAPGPDSSTTRDDAAMLLRNVADGIAAGEVAVDHEDGPVRLEIPESFNFEIEFEKEDDERELEMELEWIEVGEGDISDNAELSNLEDEQISVAPDHADIDSPDEQKTLARFELFRDRADEWRWRLVHRNGNIIATSGEGYTRKHNARKGLQSVIQNAPGADIINETNE